jgi:hypothetical protein
MKNLNENEFCSRPLQDEIYSSYNKMKLDNQQRNSGKKPTYESENSRHSIHSSHRDSRVYLQRKLLSHCPITMSVITTWTSLLWNVIIPINSVALPGMKNWSYKRGGLTRGGQFSSILLS